MRQILLGAVLAALLCAPAARAQSDSSASASANSSASSGANSDAGVAAGPAAGGHEFQIWSGGGAGIKGGVRNTGVWNAGVRYGWVLTAPHGPGFLRGRFEYAVDAVPIFWVFEPGGTAYGLSLDPVGLKWNLATKGRIAPYTDLDGGVLFTSRQTPSGISRVNFTTSSAFGMHFLRAKYNWSAEIRFLHISDAGLTSPNPGISTLQVRIGVGLFTRPK